MKKYLYLFFILLTCFALSGYCTTTVTDDFERADANPLNTNYTNFGGSWGNLELKSGGVGLNSTNDGLASYTGTAFSYDHSSEIWLIENAGDVDHYRYYVLVRAIDGSNFYYLQINTNDVVVGKCVSGSYTTIDASHGTTSNVTGDRFKFSITGTTLTTYKNGTLLDTYTDSSLSTGDPGIGVHVGTFVSLHTPIISQAQFIDLAASSTGPSFGFGGTRSFGFGN